MSEKCRVTFPVIVIYVLMAFLLLEVHTQSTVDDSASCESATLDEAVNLIREGFQDVKLVREDLTNVKNILGSNQQHCLLTELSSSKQALVSSFLCEYRTRGPTYAFDKTI